MELQTMMRSGVARTGEQIGFEVYGFSEKDGDGYSLSVLWGISLAVFGGAIRAAIRGQSGAAAVMVLGVLALYGIVAVKKGFSEDDEIDADHALVVTNGRVLVGDLENHPADRAIGALPRDTVTHARIEVAGRAASPQQGASRISLHGPRGEVGALVTPGVTVRDAVKALGGVAPDAARSTNNAGPLWFLGALGIFVSVVVAVFGAVLILGGDGASVFVGVGMVVGAAAIGFGCMTLMRQANARARERGESVRFAVDLRTSPPTPVSIETTRAGLTPMRFGITGVVGVLLVVMAVLNADSTDDPQGEIVTAGGTGVVVPIDEGDAALLADPQPVVTAPPVPASCEGTNSPHWGGQQRFGDLIVGAGHCTLFVVDAGVVQPVDVPCVGPMLLGRSRAASLTAAIPVWCDGDLVGVDPVQLAVTWQWTPTTATNTNAASELGTTHAAIQTVDGLDVVDLRTGTTAWFSTDLQGATFAGSDDLLFVSHGDVTTARSWEDGSVVWEEPIGLRWMASIEGQLFGFRNRDVVKLDPATGAVLAVSADDRHFIDGFFVGGNESYVATIAQSGTEIVVLETESLAPQLTIDGIGLSIGTVDDGLLARYDYDAEAIVVHDLVTGAQLGSWAALPARPIVWNGVLYSATANAEGGATMHATPLG